METFVLNVVAALMIGWPLIPVAWLIGVWAWRAPAKRKAAKSPTQHWWYRGGDEP